MHLHHGRRPTGRHHHERGHGRLHGFFSHGRGGRSVRRGNVRPAILTVLREQPMHGYQVITELETRTGGRWRPSAGSIYPTLQLLEDEGLVTSEIVDGRRTYSLTEAGRTAAEETDLAREGWPQVEAPGQAADPRRLARDLIGAAIQVERTGSAQANVAAREILLDTRRKLYALLAADDGDTSEASEPS